MNINDYTKKIRAEIADNDHLSADDKRVYGHIFGANIRVSDENRHYDQLYNYSNHFNVENATRAYNMFENAVLKQREPKQKFWRTIAAQDWSIPNARLCGEPVSVPFPPDDLPVDTVTAHTINRGTTQKRIFCALQNPNVIQAYTKDLGGLREIGSGTYGTGYQVQRFHDVQNDGLLVKLFFDTGAPHIRISLRHELLAGMAINDIIPLSQNLVYTYGQANNLAGCRYIMQNATNVDRSPKEPRCSGVGRSHYVLQEFAVDSKPFYIWIQNRIARMRSRQDVQDIMDVYMQVLGTISYFVNMKRASHGDLHSSNILIQELPKPITLTYFLPNGRKFEVNSRYIVKVIDYGFFAVINRNNYYVTSLASTFPELFLPAQDIYSFTANLYGYLRDYGHKDRNPAVNYLLNILANILIYGIYGRKGVDTEMSNSLLAILEKPAKGGDWVGRKVLPNWGGHSNVKDVSPAIFNDLITLINRMITKDAYNEHLIIMAGTSSIMLKEGYRYTRVNKRDLEFLRAFTDGWAMYQDIVKKQHDNKDRISADAFVTAYKSDAFTEFADAVSARDRRRLNTAQFTGLIQPMMVNRVESMGIGNPRYMDAVRGFEDVLIGYYNILAPGKIKSIIETYFDMTGLVLPEA